MVGRPHCPPRALCAWAERLSTVRSCCRRSGGRSPDDKTRTLCLLAPTPDLSVLEQCCAPA